MTGHYSYYDPKQKKNVSATAPQNSNVFLPGPSSTTTPTTSSPTHRQTGSKKVPLAHKVKGVFKKTTGDAKVEILSVPIYGIFTRMWVDVYFGEVSNRSAPCKLIIDTGSSNTWINKTVYENALRKGNELAKPYMNRSFQVSYYSKVEIKGGLYKDTISFKDKSVFVEDQIFGIVDEELNPEVKKWRKEKGILGIFGIGPRVLAQDTILDEKGKVISGKDIPTVIDNMKARHKISAKIIGINIQLPNEGNPGASNSNSASSDPNRGAVDGVLHFGGEKIGVFKPGTMKTIPATKRGTSQDFFGIDLTLRYNGVTIMNDQPGVIDSGVPPILLPESVLNAYVAAVGKHRNGKPIIVYDSKIDKYYVARADFNRLKPLEFDFVRGDNAKFKFTPAAQVCSPSLTRNWGSNGKDVYFLNFRKLARAHEGRQFILGLGWLMWYYAVLHSGIDKKIRVAEIEGQTNFRWKSLPPP